MKSSPQRQSRSRFRQRGRMLVAGLGALALALVAGACSSSGSTASSGAATKGGTAVMAEFPSSPPNYVFPFMNSTYASNSNIFDLQWLMYRPLYWFGTGAKPTLNTSLSLASPATFNGTTVTVKLKHYMWSNMLQAVPQDWGLGTGFPQDVHDITVVSPTELTMVMNKAYSPTWFQYNELSQITPIPAAWDRTASGPSNCDTTVSDCAAVYNYLNKQSQDEAGYATSPIWQIVDGPWHLSAFSSDGHMTFVPNKKYSGPIKPKLAAFEEVPFTTDSAEYDVMQSPSASTKIDYGYLPPEDAPDKPAGATTGANPLHGYTLSPLYAFGIDYYSINEQASTGNAPILKQLYFRQAMAYLTNQKAVIDGPLRGYGVPTVGPVGSTPTTPFLSSEGKAQEASGAGPFPFSIAKAKALLTSHGWKVVPGGTSTCVDPAKCGPGIAAGKALSFVFPYASGVAWITSMMTQLQSNAAQVGIKLNVEPKPASEVGAGGNCVVGHIPCNWDMAYYGNGWTFSPDFLPTGDTLFLCNGVADIGGYCNQTNDAMIEKTLTSSNLQYMYTWQNYLASQLPEIWAPDAAAQLTEIASNLKGALPQSATLSINPENWYFVK